MVTTIYCDDAGFTGDNLLQREQPFFGFAAVAVEPEEAGELVDRLCERFGVVGAELKGRILYRRPDAPELISWVLEELGPRTSVVVSDKLFSLSGKFFEYVFEPVLSRNNLFFYERGFHLHVATVVWAHLTGGDEAAARIASRFQAMLRRRGSDGPTFFDPGPAGGPVSAIGTIERFIAACRPTIESELAALEGADGRIRWVLDLGFSSARSVLRTMGERFGTPDVVFDESSPLDAYSGFFDPFVGRTEIPRFGFRRRERPLIFALERSIRFGSSAVEPGLQLADIVASFASLASRDRRTPRGTKLLDVCLPFFNEESVWPDLDHLRTERKANALNAGLLLELAARAETGQDLLEDLPEFYELISWRFDVDPPPRVAAPA